MNAHNEQHIQSLEAAKKWSSTSRRFKAALDAGIAALAAQPAAAQEAAVWQWRNLRAETGWKDCTRAVYDVFRQNGLHYEVRKLYAAPVTAAPGIDMGELAELLRIWQCNFDSGVRPDEEDEPEDAALWDRIDRIRQQADASPKGGSEACAWAGDGEGNWHTGCGSIFMLIDGSPTDNKMRHCPYCGSHISESAQAGDAEVQP